MAEGHVARLRRRWRTWRSMSAADRGLVAEAALALAGARLVLLLPYRWYAPWLSRTLGQRNDAAVAERVRRAVQIAARVAPWSAACLPRAMAARALLARRGVSSSVVIGAMPAAGPLRLHAWLESGGRIVVGAVRGPQPTPLVKYTRLES